MGARSDVDCLGSGLLVCTDTLRYSAALPYQYARHGEADSPAQEHGVGAMYGEAVFRDR